LNNTLPGDRKAGIHLEYTPNAIKYSSAAMNIVRGQFLSVQGWQEVAQE
jgi:hypothetical protein